MKVKHNRAHRLHRLLKSGWCSAWEIIHTVGTASPSKCVSELRSKGVKVQKRNARGVWEYRVQS